MATPIFVLVFKIQVDPVFIKKMVSTAWRLRWGRGSWVKPRVDYILYFCRKLKIWFNFTILSLHFIRLYFGFFSFWFDCCGSLSLVYCCIALHDRGSHLLSGSEKLVLREVFTSVQDSESLSGYIRTYVFVRFSSPCSYREMYSPELNSVHMSL